MIFGGMGNLKDYNGNRLVVGWLNCELCEYDNEYDFIIVVIGL